MCVAYKWTISNNGGKGAESAQQTQTEDRCRHGIELGAAVCAGEREAGEREAGERRERGGSNEASRSTGKVLWEPSEAA